MSDFSLEAQVIDGLLPRRPEFASEFCTPGEGHEKGGVEGEGGQFRSHWRLVVGLPLWVA